MEMLVPKTDWKTHLDMRVKARLCKELGLMPLLKRLCSPEAVELRRQLGAEYLFDLQQAAKACDCIAELTDDWENQHLQAHPSEPDIDEDIEGDKWKLT
jgi:hypothetical protein